MNEVERARCHLSRIKDAHEHHETSSYECPVCISIAILEEYLRTE